MGKKVHDPILNEEDPIEKTEGVRSGPKEMRGYHKLFKGVVHD